MGRRADETPELWYQRAVEQNRAAQASLTRHFLRLGLHRSRLRGAPVAALDEGYLKAINSAADTAAELRAATAAVARDRGTRAGRAD